MKEKKKKTTNEVGTRQSYQMKNMLQSYSKLNVVTLGEKRFSGE